MKLIGKTILDINVNYIANRTHGKKYLAVQPPNAGQNTKPKPPSSEVYSQASIQREKLKQKEREKRFWYFFLHSQNASKI